MMRVLFVSDLTLEHNKVGGAQLSNSFIVERGKQLGHEIVEHDYGSSIVDFLSTYDLLISSNLEAISNRSPEKLNFILKHPNHVRIEHDSCSYLQEETRKSLFKSSKKNFFLSKYHISFFRELYGDFFENIEIVYDPIDTDIFSLKDTPKIYDVVYCGYIHPLKGSDNLIKFARNNPDRTLDVFGWSSTQTPDDLKKYFQTESNVNYRGVVEHEEIASVFQQSKAIFHNPLVREPFCRMVAEALLCGVEELIGDKNKIGSYLEFQDVGYENFKDGCKNATTKFWDKVSL